MAYKYPKIIWCSGEVKNYYTGVPRVRPAGAWTGWWSNYSGNGGCPEAFSWIMDTLGSPPPWPGMGWREEPFVEI